MKRVDAEPFDELAEGEVHPKEQDLAAIREQYLLLDADEKRVLRRILRQAERLDDALADLHLVLPALEVCFYGLPSGGPNPIQVTPRTLRDLLRHWSNLKSRQQ